jgi:hypothetical protein
MSKDKTVVSSKESGAYSFKDKGHLKPEKSQGPHHNKAKGHELPAHAEGMRDAGKSVVHSEEVGKTHSGRALPEETILKDSKVITSAGRLAKRNE